MPGSDQDGQDDPARREQDRTSPGRSLPSVSAPGYPLTRAEPASSSFRDDEDEDEDEGDEEGGDGEDSSEAERQNYSAHDVWRAIAAVFRFIAPALASRRKAVALVLAGVLVETSFNVAFPLSLKFLIDEVLEDGDKDALVLILASLAVLGVVVSATTIAYEYVNAQLGSGVAGDIRQRLFDHLQRVSLQFYSRVKSGQVLSRFSGDMASVDDLVMHGVDWGLLPLLELVAAIGLMVYLSPQLALIALLIFPISFVGPRIFAPRAVNATYALKRRQADALGIVGENIGAQPLVRAFSLQRIAIGWYRERNETMRREMVRVRFLNALIERSLTISVLMLHLLVFGIGAVLTYEEAITLGTFIAFEGVFWELSYNIAHVTQFIPDVIETAGAVRHIDEVLDEPERAADKPDARAAPRLSREIAFESVSFGYGGGEPQIRDVSARLPAGARIAIVGASGSGKSTLLALLLRLYDPTKGRILLDGIDLADLSRVSLREQIAIVFQENVLFATSILENIRLGRPDATDADVIAAAKAAEIHSFVTRLPDRYDTVVGERGSTLSGGQRQRLAIARALVRNPAVLLLDEATSALDPTTEAAIARMLERVSRGRTLIAVTHRLHTVTGYDQILVMEEGRIVQQGRHEELLAARGPYARLWRQGASARA